MMNTRWSALCTLVVLTATAAALHAQTCYGTGPRGGLAVDHGKVDFGTTTGVTGAIASSHFAFGGGYRTVDRASNTSGNQADVRIALIFGGGSFQFCPGLGVDYEHSSWNASTGTLTSNSLTAWAGIGVGFEQPVYKGFSLIPHLGFRYAFTAIKYDFAGNAAELRTTGDTLTRGQLQYGLLGRYKIVYVGFSADHPLQSAPPLMARWVLGLTFPVRE